MPPTSPRRPTVWIVNRGGHPYKSAEKFGTLVPLTTGKINPFRPDRLAHEIASKLKHCREDDMLLFSGPPVANALAMFLWLAKHDKVNVLIWSATGHDYEVRTIDVELISLMHE